MVVVMCLYVSTEIKNAPWTIDEPSFEIYKLDVRENVKRIKVVWLLSAIGVWRSFPTWPRYAARKRPNTESACRIVWFFCELLRRLTN